MKKLIKSKEEFEAFIADALKQHVKDFDGGSENMWQDISDGDIVSIKPPRSYPAIIDCDLESSNCSCWCRLIYHWTTKEDLGL